MLAVVNHTRITVFEMSFIGVKVSDNVDISDYGELLAAFWKGNHLLVAFSRGFLVELGSSYKVTKIDPFISAHIDEYGYAVINEADNEIITGKFD